MTNFKAQISNQIQILKFKYQKILTFGFWILFVIWILSFGFFNTAQAALVPCGTSTTPPCTWCHLMQLIKNVINFLMYLVFPLAAIMIVVGGIMIMTAGGSTERVAKGKEIVTAAVVGLLIALLSWLILDTIIRTLTNTQQPEGFKAKWYEVGKNVNCP